MSTNFSKVKAIIFDFDDTLVKTRQTKYAAQKYAGQKFYNLKITDKKLAKHWGEPFLTFMGNVYDHVDETANIVKNYFSIVHKFPNQIYEDANELIGKLSPKYKLGIVSAMSKKFLVHDAGQAGLNIDKFAFVQGEEQTQVHKPNPDVFSPTLEFFAKFGINKKEMVYVGDSLSDYEAAQGAGISFIGVADRTVPKVEFDKKKITTIQNLFELFDLI